MFTGIVEHIGTIKSIAESDGNTLFTIADASPILSDCHIGDSIAVNGVCLTVVSFTRDEFAVGVSAETFRRTNLGSFRIGSKVNLERAMSPSGDVRFGGHYVQGHVDGVAVISDIRKDDDGSLLFTFRFQDSPQLINYVVEKGFICIDGTSLTVTKVGEAAASFSIMMVVHTQKHVVLPQKKVGNAVNVEVDVSAKVIEKQVSLQLEGQFANEDSPLVKLIEKLVAKKVQELK